MLNCKKKGRTDFPPKKKGKIKIYATANVKI